MSEYEGRSSPSSAQAEGMPSSLRCAPGSSSSRAAANRAAACACASVRLAARVRAARVASGSTGAAPMEVPRGPVSSWRERDGPWFLYPCRPVLSWKLDGDLLCDLREAPLRAPPPRCGLMADTGGSASTGCEVAYTAIVQSTSAAGVGDLVPVQRNSLSAILQPLWVNTTITNI